MSIIDLEAVLEPIPGDNPAGENLRYTPVYDQIQEARKEDDAMDRGDWERDIKTADWHLVKETTVEALTQKSKDLQIAIWLMEALVKTEGLPGLNEGLRVIKGLMETFWDHLYPEIEDDDLDYRVGPLEFMNEKLWMPIKGVPLTDPSNTPGYTWYDWQDSLKVGAESSILDGFGSVDGEKKQAREDLIAEGKPTVEDVDSAVTRSSRNFFEELNACIEQCLESFEELDNLIDEKFENDAPRTADFKQAIEDCGRFVTKRLKEKRELDPDPEPLPETGEGDGSKGDGEADDADQAAGGTSTAAPAGSGQIVVGQVSDTEALEDNLWRTAIATLNSSGIKIALDTLFSASCSATSIRTRTRYRLLMVKLCLRADRPDLARPIAEELNGLLEELSLEKWESPVWIAEVIGALYQILSLGEAGDDDSYKAEELFQKLCTIDVTKAMKLRKRT